MSELLNIPRFNKDAPFSYLYAPRKQVCTANRTVHRRLSPSLMSNDVRRRGMKRDSGCFARTIHRNSSENEGRNREKSVSCLPVSLEPELYLVITSALSRRVYSRLPWYPSRPKPKLKPWRRKTFVEHAETPASAPNVNHYSRSLIKYDRE